MDGFDFDVDLAVLQSMYDAQGYDPQSDYVLDDFRTDVYEFLDEFSTFLYGSFGFDGDGEPEPCGDGLGSDDEPCGTPPGPDEGPWTGDEIIVEAAIIRFVDVAAWSYANAEYLFDGGGGWSVRIDSGGGDIITEEDTTAEDEHNERCAQLDEYEREQVDIFFEAAGDIGISRTVGPQTIIQGWLVAFGAVGSTAIGIHRIADDCE